MSCWSHRDWMPNRSREYWRIIRSNNWMDPCSGEVTITITITITVQFSIYILNSYTGTIHYKIRNRLQKKIHANITPGPLELTFDPTNFLIPSSICTIVILGNNPIVSVLFANNFCISIIISYKGKYLVAILNLYA